ncbi:hypothetical protein [uncultured Endozoicomonas sp.]|uniref:hypothetical protein n=1 Tax=uncultured Endozoicomonas sp. TaxID=432652 RepID=UPI00263355C2|nr:hypothetical protein [uncultured Endozoicomonas sp.]
MSAVNQVVEYGVTDAALNELRERYNSVPDAATKEGMKTIKAALKELVPLRTGVEKKRKVLVADAVAWQKKVNSEAKRITGRILEIETPLQEAKKEVDNAEKIKEQKRVDDIQQRIECYKNIPLAMLQASSAELKACIDDLKADQVTGFAEFEIDALKARNDAVAHLEGIHDLRIVQEKQSQEQHRQPEPEEFAPFADPDPVTEDDMEPFFVEESEYQQAADRQEAIKALVQLHSIDDSLAHAVVKSIEAGQVPGVYTVFNYEGEC